VIEFVLDGRSKVATYMQLVQQVRQALRVGLAHPGDQLPKVREVAQALAINPNTVLKAYRDLDHEGLVDARRGQGTFVSSRVFPDPPPDVARLQRELGDWVKRARAAGVDDEGLYALFGTVLHRMERAA